ncbi:nuclear pore complex protein Nup153 isoform X2 [Eupeodes corollae]|uniref:nuclear pore complex protein Nup153 isoform X2 n=1 Tax=Eupeodes corollae TaxID=290404 RepID=UPI002491B79A|nr:nuclear pore complex protein Nup153 isoform X2 [Eupeodes corollae]
MSEPDSPTRRGDLHHHHHHQQQQQLHQSGDERDEANNSIIGKVRSRVSSILPQQLTKWFSPSASAANLSQSNGGVGASRRRRRNEEDDHEPRADNSDNDEDDDGSDNSGGEDADEYSSPISAQPPTKRSRLNVEETRTNFKDNQKLVSSTPTLRGRQRTTFISLHGNRKEPAYNFGPQPKFTTTNTLRSVVTEQSSTVDSADIIEVVPERNLLNTSMSSRRSLNIPSSTSTESHRNLNDFKRRSMMSMRTAGAGVGVGVGSGASYVPQSCTGTIIEGNDDEDDNEDEERRAVTQNINRGDEDLEVDDDDDNEESEEIAKVTSKKPKFTNGNRMGRSSSVATESGESRSSSVAQVAAPKSGLFNQGNRSLRTMSGNGLNFYSHLEGRKSLFSEKNMPGMLNNSTLSLTSLNRRQFNSSIYGSTSALSDSRLLHTSSPFYKGQTTYGGAAAYSKFNRSLNQSVRIAPTLIRPTSSLSTLSSSTNSLAQGNDQSNSTAISNTAKRILELINDFSTPLNDAKKMASNIKTPSMLANRNAAGKRFSEADLASARSVRLSTVRKPYTRPAVTLNPTNNDSKKLLPPLKELQVPSMSQLLQMKKMQNCTERSRQIANTSKSALNRECEYKLPGQDEEQTTDKNANKHVSKIKNKVTASSRVSSKNNHAEDEEPPAPANLPNIAFPFMRSVPKIDIAVNNTAASPQQPKVDFKFASAPEAKPTNNFNFGLAKEPEKSTEKPKPSVNFNFGSGSSSSTTTPSNSEFKFSSPVSVSCTPSKGDIAPINNFKFSSPLIVGRKEAEKEKTAPPTAAASPQPQLKTGSVLDALKKPTEKAAPLAVAKPPITQFGDQFKKPSNEWECSACMIRNKDTADKCVACTTPRVKPAAAAAAPTLSFTNTNSLAVKNTFGEAFKPKSDTWECEACMVRNKSDAAECVACCTKKPGAAAASTTASAPKLQTTDVGFKSLVAQQKASKWECDACMTRNDAERNKCVCCEQAKPGTQVVSDSVPQFNFGTSSASKFTFGFGGAAGAKKEDELKAEAVASSKTENKSGFTFGMPAKANDASVSSSGFSFGIKPQSDTPAITSKDVPDVVKTNATTGFKFGVQSADSSKSDSSTTATTTPATGFSFGLKPAAAPDTKSANVTFKLPSATAEIKNPTNTNSTVTSTSSTPASSSMFNTITSSAFGGVKKPEEVKPAAETKGLVFGALNTNTNTNTPAPAAAIKPITFNATTDENKMPPKATFGSPGFVFGKPATTTSSAFSPKAPTTMSPGFAFGKDMTSGSSTAPSLFGSPSAATSSTSGAPSKSATPVFGAAAGANAAAPATATVSSSTTGFIFGKPATTSLFGAAAASSSTTTATSSVFGSKPAAPNFSAPAAAVGATTTSTISSTGLSIANTSSSTNPSPAPFVFGSSGGSSSAANTNNKPVFGASTFEASSGTAAAPATTASSWPTNTFTFGSTKPPEEPKSNALPAFGSPASIFGQTTPMFGSSQQQQQQVGEVKPMVAAAPPSAVPSFGTPSATSTIFGSNTTAPSGGASSSSNMFGSSSSTPVFGSSMGFEGFGAPAATATAPAAPSNSSTNPAAMPTFGSSAFSSGFGSLAAASSSGSGDGAPAPKKADMAFNFGSAQTSTNSGFSFGGTANKPAADAVFKFSTSSTPSFNFTGATESTNIAQPFQFGAPTSTPAVFNFGGVEGANSGGPFQFNAAAPTAATNNIFAPMPTPGIVGSQQAARRKMRPVTRRTQPR